MFNLILRFLTKVVLFLERNFDHPVTLISLMEENFLKTENMRVCLVLGGQI